MYFPRYSVVLAACYVSLKELICDTTKGQTLRNNDSEDTKMTEKTAQQIARMKAATIGVEIEMNNITREKAAKVAAEFFGTNHTEYTASRNGYYTWSAWDAQGGEWKFQRDVSIAEPDSEKCEMVTPILHYSDIETLQELVRRLRKAGAVSHAGIGAGVHCHIGAQGHTPQSLRNLANIMASHEGLILEALKVHESRINRFCRTIEPRFVEAVNKKKPTTMAQLANIWYTTNGADSGRSQHYNSSRYHVTNYHSVFTHGTIEFRCYEFERPTADRKNGLHAGRLKTFIQLSLALSEMAKTVKTASPKPQQHDNPKFAMRTWLIRMGMVGEEFATARTILTKNLTGDNAFRYGRP